MSNYLRYEKRKELTRFETKIKFFKALTLKDSFMLYFAYCPFGEGNSLGIKICFRISRTIVNLVLKKCCRLKRPFSETPSFGKYAKKMK